jgi:hypothetical protein
MRIETYRFFGMCVAIASGAAMMACSDSGSGAAGTAGKAGGSAGSTATMTGAGGAATGTTSTTASTTGTGGSGTGGSGTGGSSAAGCALCTNMCSPAMPVVSATISDFEGEAGLAVTAVEPHGVWAMDKDISPAGLGSYLVEPCGTTGNGLHFKGSNFTIWGADVAAAFITNTQPIDASAYAGISFVIKSATPVSVIVKVQNADSQPAPACGNCVETVPATLGSECYAGYLKIVSSDTAASPIPQMLRWADITKAGWGYHFPAQFVIDPTQLMSIAFAVDKNTDFDLCIDDVKFFQ